MLSRQELLHRAGRWAGVLRKLDKQIAALGQRSPLAGRLLLWRRWLPRRLAVPPAIAGGVCVALLAAALVAANLPNVIEPSQGFEATNGAQTSHEEGRITPAPPPEKAPASQEATRPAPPPSLASVDPLPEWAQTTGNAVLWSQSGNSAEELLRLPDRSRVQITGQRENGRAPAFCSDVGPNEQGLAGWINLDALQPVAAPSRPIASSRGGSRPSSNTDPPARFFARVLKGAQDSERETRVPTSVTIAQAILESEWGRSLLSIKAQNYFGIKALSGSGPAGVINMDTWEVVGGSNTTVNAAFKAYHNADESIMDHGRFLADNPRYAAAFQTTDAREFARRIQRAGYATDPAYSTKLIGLMDGYDLYRYDLSPGSD